MADLETLAGMDLRAPLRREENAKARGKADGISRWKGKMARRLQAAAEKAPGCVRLFQGHEAPGVADGGGVQL